ncbi:MAG: hypothetical protein U9Q12_03585, partial [Patescibacteria group bacterium]|nr:hypothetical protein [Patescibacteria group bacterium]
MNFSTSLDICSLGYSYDEMYNVDDDAEEEISTLEKSIGSDTIGVGVTFSLDKKTSNILVSKIHLYIGDNPEPIVTYEGGTGYHYYFKGNFNHKYWATYWKHFDKENLGGLEKLLNRDILLDSDISQFSIGRSPDINEILNKFSFKKKVAFLLKERKSVRTLYKAMKQDPSLEKMVQKLSDKIQQRVEKDVSSEKVEDIKYHNLEKALEETTITEEMTDFEWAIEAYKIIFEDDIINIIEGFLPQLINNINLKDIMEQHVFYKERRHVSLLAFPAADLIKNFLFNIQYIGPIREYPERTYIYGGNPLQYVGPSGKMVFDVLFNNPELINTVNKEFERIGVNYELKLSPLSKGGTEINEAFSPHLFDKSTGVPVSFRDVGFGFSQVLPIIVQSMLENNTTLLIEQPEL